MLCRAVAGLSSLIAIHRRTTTDDDDDASCRQVASLCSGCYDGVIKRVGRPVQPRFSRPTPLPVSLSLCLSLSLSLVFLLGVPSVCSRVCAASSSGLVMARDYVT